MLCPGGDGGESEGAILDGSRLRGTSLDGHGRSRDWDTAAVGDLAGDDGLPGL